MLPKAILVLMIVLQPAPTVRRLVIPVRAHQMLVCAEYLTDADPRVPNRACVDADTVRDWLLRNAGPHDEVCGGDHDE